MCFTETGEYKNDLVLNIKVILTVIAHRSGKIHFFLHIRSWNRILIEKFTFIHFIYKGFAIIQIN